VSCALERQVPPNGRLINFSVDGELCVLPSRVIILCVTDTAIRQYTIILLIFWSGWGRQPGCGETWTSFWVSERLNGWVYVARAQGLALLFNEWQYRIEDLGEMGLDGTGIYSQQYRSFLWQ